MLQDTQLCQYCRLAVRRADTRTWFWQQFHVQYDSSKSARYSEGERRASSAPAIATQQLRKGQQEPHRVGFFGPTGSASCCCGSTGRHITFMHHTCKRHGQSHFEYWDVWANSLLMLSSPDVFELTALCAPCVFNYTDSHCLSA